ncbi:enoyl-CoA hydratase-related protein [Rhodoferax sp. GW822-FHT02A01]|uniref:enoyl-CoA hydratase-related protein n=1 Tax=Rhodoferax sp. GW822-FHT02A01 TaxID=3141537 RepID=UPI00315D6098
MPFLTVTRENGVVVATMSEPSTKNAITDNSAVDEFDALCQEIENNPEDKVLIITGNGKVFSSGGNISTMYRCMSSTMPAFEIVEDYRNGIQRLPLLLRALSVPTIAAVNGPAIGAGCDLTCMCDVRIASTEATFAESFIHFGIVPGDGGAWFLPRIVGTAKAAEMSFTGDGISAAEALGIGLVSKVVPPGELMAAVKELAARMARHGSAALRLTKRLLRQSEEQDLKALLDMSASYQSMLHKTNEHRMAVADYEERRANTKLNREKNGRSRCS